MTLEGLQKAAWSEFGENKAVLRNGGQLCSLTAPLRKGCSLVAAAASARELRHLSQTNGAPLSRASSRAK